MQPSSTTPIPLARLFASAVGVLLGDLEERLVERGWTDIRPSWGFVIGRMDLGPTTINDLADFLGVSKQAASKTIEHMTTAGLVRMTSFPGDGRKRIIEFTDDGCRFRQDVKTIYADIEAGWARIMGHDELEQMRDTLVTVLMAVRDGTLPPPSPIK